MKLMQIVAAALICSAISVVSAQTPLAPDTQKAADAMVGNQVLQLRYLTKSPFAGVGNSAAYGVLFTENREFMFSAALLFDVNVVPTDRLRLQIGPEMNAAWLATGQKTDVFAVALGATARYDLIRSIGLTAFGSAFYSPGVITFGAAHNMYDFAAGAEVRLNGGLYLTAGYRWLKFTLVNQTDERLANEPFAGIRWQLQ